MGLSLDPFIRKVLNPIAVVLFLILISPTLFVAVVLWQTSLLTQPEPSLARFLIDTATNFTGLPADFVKVAATALPALVTSICVTNRSALSAEASGVLTLTGRIVFLVLGVGLALAIAEVVFINPGNENQAMALRGELPEITLLESSASAVLHLATTYLALLLGLQIEVKK